MVFKTVKNKFLRRGRKDSQKQKLKTEAQTPTAEEASSDAPVNLDGSSTLTPPPADTPPAQSSPPGGSSSKSSPTLTDGDTPIQDLWNLAYTNLRIEDEELIAKYEAQLSGNLSAGLVLTLGSKFCVKDHMHAILQRKMDEVNRDAWKLKFGSSDVQVREVVQPVLGVVNRANNFITAAVSANPYASLAWVGVSVLLPVSWASTHSNRHLNHKLPPPALSKPFGTSCLPRKGPRSHFVSYNSELDVGRPVRPAVRVGIQRSQIVDAISCCVQKHPGETLSAYLKVSGYKLLLLH